MELTPRERAVFIAHRHDHRSLTDIAHSCGLTRSAISKTYCRAKQKIENLGYDTQEPNAPEPTGRTVVACDPQIIAATIGS